MRRHFHLPRAKYLKKIMPNPDGTATLTFEKNGKVKEKTIPFSWDRLAEFEAQAQAHNDAF